MRQKIKGKYFALTEVCFLSLMAALVYVLRAFIKTPTHGFLPGHNAIIWVIPFIIGLGLIRKFGSATYIGVVSGLLLGILGDHEGGLKFFEYLAMGFTMDVVGLFFKGHLDNIVVCVALGAFGSFAKFVVNYGLAILLSQVANVLLAGVAWPATIHLIFGGAGGIIAFIVLNRVKHVHFPHQPLKKSADSEIIET
jgi:ABC-type thiamin/hydroxymethylpyrimidine transport system permease subunit